MIKEILLAVILGVLLGFGATNTLVAIRKSKTITPPPPPITPLPPSPNPTNLQPTATATSQNEIPLSIDQPENEDVFSNSKIILRGSTIQNGTIIVRTPLKSYTAIADPDGRFTLEIELETGVNLITVTAIDSQGGQTDTDLTLTYSTSKF